jgi:hypothetical protein
MQGICNGACKSGSPWLLDIVARWPAYADHAWHHGESLRRLGEIVQDRLMQFAGTDRGPYPKGPVSGVTKQRFYDPKPLARVEAANAEPGVRSPVRYAAGAREA